MLTTREHLSQRNFGAISVYQIFRMVNFEMILRVRTYDLGTLTT